MVPSHRRGRVPLLRKPPQALCAQCGHPRVIRRGVRTPACPRCASTTTLTCPTCGGGTFSLSTSEGVDRCLGCRLRPWIITALAGGDGQVPSQLMPFVIRLAAAEDHNQVRRWLHRGPAMTVLKEMAQGRAPIAHSTLDEAAGEHRARATSVEHLRRLLVAAEVLPRRDEHLTRLERDIRARLTALDPDDATVLRRFVTWYTLPRTRLRIAQGRDPEGTCRLATQLSDRTVPVPHLPAQPRDHAVGNGPVRPGGMGRGELRVRDRHRDLPAVGAPSTSRARS